MARALLPRPPALHWALVALFTMLTLGIFGWIWYFIQSGWVKKVDPRSNATLYLAFALVSMLVAVSLSIYGMLANGGEPPLGASIAVLLVEVVMLVFLYCAFFSMAASLRDEMPKRGLRMSIGGVTLFFATSLYLQGQLSWIARWKDTGRKEPGPPKGIFWALLAAVFCLAFVAAIALPAYVSYREKALEQARLIEERQRAMTDASNAEPALIQPDTLPAAGSVTGLQDPVDPVDPSAQAADAAGAAADAAAQAADAAAAGGQTPAYDMAELARQRAQADVELQREELQLERKRLMEQRRRIEEQERQLQEDDMARRRAEAERPPTADELYESRRQDCPKGFLGSGCRKQIRMEVCEGHWSVDPEPGYQLCKP